MEDLMLKYEMHQQFKTIIHKPINCSNLKIYFHAFFENSNAKKNTYVVTTNSSIKRSINFVYGQKMRNLEERNF